MKPETLNTLKSAIHGVRWASSLIQEDTNKVLASGDHIALIKHFAEVREANQQLKELRQVVDIMSDRLSYTEVPDALRRVGVKTVTVDGVGRVSVAHRWSCSIINKPVGHEWLRSEGHGGLITETVNASTLSAFAKDLNDTKGIELPRDIFTTSINSYTSITKVA